VENVCNDRVTRRRRGTSAHIAAIPFVLWSNVVEEEDHRRNWRPAGQSALIRSGGSEPMSPLAWQRAATNPSQLSAVSAARHLSTRHRDHWTPPAGSHNIKPIIH
jgi:hypothetical protein